MVVEWRSGSGRQPPIVTLPWRVSVCPNCYRIFEARFLYCPLCDVPTRLYSPIKDYVQEMGGT